MIKWDMMKDERIIQGNRSVILAELSSIIHYLYHEEFITDVDIDEIIRLAKLTNDEVREESTSAIMETLIKAANGDKRADKLIKMLLGIHEEEE